jgi:LPS-assembly protein
MERLMPPTRTCYGFRLATSPSTNRLRPSLTFPCTLLCNTVRVVCHAFIAITLILLPSSVVRAQVEQDTRRPLDDLGAGPPPAAVPEQKSPEVIVKKGPSADLTVHDIDLRFATQTIEGDWVRLRGAAEVETTTELLRAEEIDYNQVTGQVLARGNVRYNSYVRGEIIRADRVDYSIKEETGKFYGVHGEAPAPGKRQAGLLATDNPFIFEGEWAERIGKRYLLHNGFITNCRIPNPWWVLRASRFDIEPGQRALAYRSWFRLKGVPLFYTPLFYKSLEEKPRKSGFLTPNIGSGSNRGFMLGAGYFWAISRSYDVTYRATLFTKRGIAHNLDFRAKPTQKSSVDAIFYGLGDKLNKGGYSVSVHGKSDDAPWGFKARADINYLSSFAFRQNFTDTFNEAVYGEVRSTGSFRKEWSYYALGVTGERSELFSQRGDGTFSRLSIRRVPSLEFSARDRQLHRELPVWVSLESSMGFLNRTQPAFETRNYVDRLDVAPRVSAALHLGDFHFAPYASVRETHYGSSLNNGQVVGDGVRRSAREWGAELVLPAISRIFDTNNWLGEKVKHVIEPRATFRDRSGIANYANLIRFDDIDVMTATRQVDYSLTQRLISKSKGQTREIASWTLMQQYYLDATFGGTLKGVTTGRYVIDSQTTLTGFAFLDRPRRFSPVVSSFRWYAGGPLSGEWRADYDPDRHRFINSSLSANVRKGLYFVSLGHNLVRSDPKISPQSNQLIGAVGVGNADARGWSAGFSSVYDFRQGTMQYATSQVSYNSNCCGISFQYRRLSFRDSPNQYRVAFSIANIGSFGTLRRQERIF